MYTQRVTLAWRTFLVFFKISVLLSLFPPYTLPLAVWWGLGIHHFESRNISNMNLTNCNHSATDGTHAFVTWLAEGDVICWLFEKECGGGGSLQFEARIRQRVLQSLCSRERRKRASWTKRGMSLILLICAIIFIPLFVHYYSHECQLNWWLSCWY